MRRGAGGMFVVMLRSCAASSTGVADGLRTRILLVHNQVLRQLSYDHHGRPGRRRHVLGSGVEPAAQRVLLLLVR